MPKVAEPATQPLGGPRQRDADIGGEMTAS